MQFMPLDDSIIGIVITVIDPDESLAFLRLARKKKYHFYLSKTWREVDKNLRIKCV